MVKNKILMIFALLVCGKYALNLQACCRKDACRVAPGLEIPDLMSWPFRYIPYLQRDRDPAIKTWVVENYPHLKPQSSFIGQDSIEYKSYAASIHNFRKHLTRLSCWKIDHFECYPKTSSPIQTWRCPVIVKAYLDNQCHSCPAIRTSGKQLSPDAICETHYCPNIQCFPLYAGLITAFTSPCFLKDRFLDERSAR